MIHDTGLRGPVKESKNEWEIEYKVLNEQLKSKKILIEEICQERANPLIPPDGIIDEDIGILQYFGSEKLKENSGKKTDIHKTDLRNFKKARKEIVYKGEDFLTVKILPKKRYPSKGISTLQKNLKIKKKF
ncbi:hypothetical protein SteCoe_28350 [Stentor coeruleus]|uniref:Uncharacterized protein n=1 Tax=Stentor coeruleus TaxID=5963 RepID=A0A1R2B8Y9_9CILI|nr:hypothetical protein SteCoe_28350 [Stentor coeruleus]